MATHVVTAMLTCAIVMSSICVESQQAPAINQQGSVWQKIGEVRASSKLERESIAVFDRSPFKAIKLKAVNADLSLRKITIFFASGDKHEIDVNASVHKGGETQAYTLNNSSASIRKVTFTYSYNPVSKGFNVHVEMYGNR